MLELTNRDTVSILSSKLFRHIIPPLIAGILVIGGMLVFLLPIQSGGQAQNIVFPTDNLQFLMGSGRKVDNKLLIESYENGVAVISSGPVNIQSDANSVLSFQLNANQSAYNPVFFWRQKGNLKEVSRIDLSTAGAQLIDLKLTEDWTGDIVEIGFLFQDPQAQIAELSDVSLDGKSPVTVIKLVLQDWLQYEPWTQKSINSLYGGAAEQRVYLPLVLLTWVFLSVLLYALINRHQVFKTATFTAGIFLIAWMVLDVRWTNNRIEQTSQSLQNLLQKNQHEKLLSAPDGSLYEYIFRIKRDVLSKSPKKILLVGDESESDYILLKAKYHLLPHAASVSRQLGEPISAEHLDYVLFFGGIFKEEESQNSTAAYDDLWEQLPISSRWHEHLKLVDAGNHGLLFAVSIPEDPD